MRELRGRTAVVTGAASGIGLALCERFAAEGLRLVMADVDTERLAAASEALAASSGVEIAAQVVDVADFDSVQALADTAFERFGAVHLLCNNAGVVAPGKAWEISIEDWRWVVGVNLWGVLHGIKAFVPRMVADGQPGHVVNTASMAGLIGFANLAPYTATKFAVVGASESLFHDLKAQGADIGVSVLAPGSVQTNLAASSGRLRPGATGAAAQTPPAGAIRQLMAASELADQVVEAVRADRFWVLTHPAYGESIARRTLGILGDGDPIPPARL